MDSADLAVILLDIAIIIVAARALGLLMRRLGQPAVVGEICAGVLLGPTLLGEDLTGVIFPVDQRQFLLLLANIGLVLFMFVVGMELEPSLVRGRERVATSVSVGSILLPFGLGIGLAVWLYGRHGSGRDPWVFALFVGASMSVTAFPVLARILTERGMHRTALGGLALACAAVDDILAWSILAVVVSLAGDSDGSWRAAMALPYVVLMVVVVRPQLRRLGAAYERAGRLTPGILAVVLVGVFASAAATEWMHIHFIFGAFLFGALLPREGTAAMRHEILVRLEQVSVLLFLPVFFLVTGLKVDLSGTGVTQALELLAILAVAVVGKFVGAYVGARTQRVPVRQAGAIATLMNTRGLTELVILKIGLDKGILDEELYGLLVAMALVTTLMTGPLLRRIYPDRRVARDVAEAERAALGVAPGFRVLAVIDDLARAGSLVELGAQVAGRQRPATLVLSHVRSYEGGRLEVGAGLTFELATMAGSIEEMEALRHRAEGAGVEVAVATRFASDPVPETVAQVASLSPDVVLLASGSPVKPALVASWTGLVLEVKPDAEVGGPVVVEVDDGIAGRAAVAVGVRISAARGSALTLVPAEHRHQRRAERLAQSLSRLGVEVTVGAGGGVLVAPATTGRGAPVVVHPDPDTDYTEWPELVNQLAGTAST